MDFIIIIFLIYELGQYQKNLPPSLPLFVLIMHQIFVLKFQYWKVRFCCMGSIN